MKSIVLPVIAVLLWFASDSNAFAQSGSRTYQGAATQEKLSWHQRVDVAVEAQRTQRKPLLVYVTSNSCGHCRKMDATTWADPDVIRQLNETFVTLKLSEESHAETVAKLGIQGFPTTIIYDSNGRVVDVKEGFASAATMLQKLAPHSSREQR